MSGVLETLIMFNDYLGAPEGMPVSLCGGAVYPVVCYVAAIEGPYTVKTFTYNSIYWLLVERRNWHI